MLNVLGYALILLFFAAPSCGPKSGFSVAPAEEQSGYNGDLITNKVNSDGINYTGFSPSEAFIAMKSNVELTEENQKFADEIEKINFSTKDKQLNIQVKLKGISSPLIFNSELWEKDGTYVATDAVDLTGQQTNFRLDATCSALDCRTVNLYIKDGKKRKVGAILREEQRTLRIKIPADLAQDKPEDKTQKSIFVESIKSGKKVTVKSTEIFPGKSSFEIVDPNSDNNKISGELLATNDGGYKINSSGEFLNLGQAMVIGNSNDGENLMIKFSPSSDDSSETSVPLDAELGAGVKKKGTKSKSQASKPEVYVTIDERSPTTTPDKTKKASGRTTFVSANNKNSHSLVQQILADSNRPEIKTWILKHVYNPKRKNRRGEVEIFQGELYGTVKKYIGCLSRDSVACGTEKGSHSERQPYFNQMIYILRQNGFPAAMSFVSGIESEFNSNALSSKGAYGWWQFMPDIGKSYGLRVDPKDRRGVRAVDERGYLKESTVAAVKMYKDLLKEWNGDLKMALASYNGGSTATRKGCKKAGIFEKCKSRIAGRSFDEIIDQWKNVANKDFWVLYRYNTLSKESQNYVMKFLSGNIIANNPEAFSFAGKSLSLN